MVFLVKRGTLKRLMEKKVSKYTAALFEKVRIEIDTKGLLVHVLLREKILNESQIVHILLQDFAK